MSQCVLMIYEALDNIKDKRGYWKQYIEFYEKYWDGPATLQSSWWGMEYEEFRNSLAENLGIEKEYIENAFFLKNESDEYFLCPIGNKVNMNIIASEDIIPYEWLLMFNSQEKDYFYTHTGFGAVHHDAIYYKTSVSEARSRLGNAFNILGNTLSDNDKIKDHPDLTRLTFLKNGIGNISQWLEGFSENGVIILNYGEICNRIEQNSFRNEDSVGEINSIINAIDNGDLGLAESNLRILNVKWASLSGVSAEDHSGSGTLQ